MTPTPLQVLPTNVPGVRRSLVRGDDGAVRERVEGVEVRAQELPQGGVFGAWQIEGGVLDLGEPLARTLRVLEPPLPVLLGLVLRVLEDLEALHAAGCVHGALHAEGWGVGVDGVFRVRPVLHEPAPQASTPWASDLAGVAAVLRVARRRVDGASMEAAGIARGALWLRGMGLAGASGSVTYADPRAARQALVAVLRDVALDAALESWLASEQVRMPARGAVTGGRRVRATAAAADAERSARAWVEREVARSRAEGLVRMREDVERVLREDRAAMEAVLESRRDRQVEAARAREAVVGEEREARRREEDARRVAAASRLALAAAPVPVAAATPPPVAAGARLAGVRVAVAPPPDAMRVDGIVLGAAPAPVAAVPLALSPTPAPLAPSPAPAPAAPLALSPTPAPVAPLALSPTPAPVAAVPLAPSPTPAPVAAVPLAPSPTPASVAAVPLAPSPAPAPAAPLAPSPTPAPAAPLALSPTPAPVAAVPLALSPTPAPVASAAPLAPSPAPPPVAAAPLAPSPAPAPVAAVPLAPSPTPAPVAAVPLAPSPTPAPVAAASGGKWGEAPPTEARAARVAEAVETLAGAPPPPDAAWSDAPRLRGDATREHERGAGKWVDAEAPEAVARVRQAVSDLDGLDRAEGVPWGGLGITGSDARMHEKGPGKWAEVDADEAAARARARVAELGDAAPARDVDLSEPAPSGRKGKIVALVGLLLAVGLAVWLAG